MAFRQCVCAAVMMVGLAVPSTAWAQARAFVGGLGGLTFGADTSGAVAGQVGVRLTPTLMLIAEGGYMRNVMPQDFSDDLQSAVDLLETTYDVAIDVRVSIPSTYGFGGLRWTPSAGNVAPFIEGGIGVGRISLKVDEAKVLGIDFSDELRDQLESEDTNTTELLLAIGGGVALRVSQNLTADLGYRYTRIATDEPTVNSSMVYGALKVGF